MNAISMMIGSIAGVTSSQSTLVRYWMQKWNRSDVALRRVSVKKGKGRHFKSAFLRVKENAEKLLTG